MGKDNISFLTVMFTRVIGLMTRSRVEDRFIWTLETCMKEVGRMARNMDLGSIPLRIVIIMRDNLLKE